MLVKVAVALEYVRCQGDGFSLREFQILLGLRDRTLYNLECFVLNSLLVQRCYLFLLGWGQDVFVLLFLDLGFAFDDLLEVLALNGQWVIFTGLLGLDE